MQYVPDKFCRNCSADLQVHGQEQPHDWGMRCTKCNKVFYHTQESVGVLIVPAGNHPDGEHGVWAGRRAYGRFAGQLCLPSGFIMKGEDWRAGLCREAYEELGLVLRYGHSSFERPEEFMTESSTGGAETLTFAKVGGAFMVEEPFKPNDEITERMVIFPDTEEQLCFPLHRQALAQYWSDKMVPHRVAA